MHLITLQVNRYLCPSVCMCVRNERLSEYFFLASRSSSYKIYWNVFLLIVAIFQEVKLRSFNTKVHKVSAAVSYKSDLWTSHTSNWKRFIYVKKRSSFILFYLPTNQQNTTLSCWKFILSNIWRFALQFKSVSSTREPDYFIK